MNDEMCSRCGATIPMPDDDGAMQTPEGGWMCGVCVEEWDAAVTQDVAMEVARSTARR